ncbi:hypothetical protein AcW1_000629 [Taiwanofungus camphoratus]|nr:hypothetical protein AcW1_000629 [Antrodia cinnamomea]
MFSTPSIMFIAPAACSLPTGCFTLTRSHLQTSPSFVILISPCYLQQSLSLRIGSFLAFRYWTQEVAFEACTLLGPSHTNPPYLIVVRYSALFCVQRRSKFTIDTNVFLSTVTSVKGALDSHVPGVYKIQ